MNNNFQELYYYKAAFALVKDCRGKYVCSRSNWKYYPFIYFGMTLLRRTYCFGMYRGCVELSSRYSSINVFRPVCHLLQNIFISTTSFFKQESLKKYWCKLPVFFVLKNCVIIGNKYFLLPVELYKPRSVFV